ncbi:DUF4185 domain-containing protein [Mycolicibacterium sp. HK-90]|uniref:DUF4185 domain-containing protein n=1 Tax=Mycolicibacterium sp. HK-90 TaxID=3056937 RepID=UPI00265AD37D|nr:DUF4185 domain-containing protein [Mycolicibacterium sp. HK-90]WKG01872.1 DUF4185 domain-containing protein [Mycolicibacterium sp. HK-90]
MSLKLLRDWVPEIADLAKSTRAMSANHSNSAEFYQRLVTASTWQGEAAQEAVMSMLMSAAAHDVKAVDLSAAADVMDRAEQDAEVLANTVKAILDDAAAPPTVEVDQATNEVIVPPNYDDLDDETKTAVSEKIADLEARIADAEAEGDRIDGDLAKAIARATGMPEPTSTPTSLPELLGVPGDGSLSPGEVRNMGPVAGTDNPNGIPGIRAADLGEVITLPNGKKVAIFGDSYGNPAVGGPDNPHYPSVAVPVTFDKSGRPHFGPPLTGTNLNSGLPNESPGPNTLFPLPEAARAAGANNALPAGSVTIGKDTYMMVVGTNTNEGLNPKGGSWLVKVTNDPAAGWQPVAGSYEPWKPNGDPGPGHAPVGTNTSSAPTQISGYQGDDGMVYIAADAFDRSQGVSMYRVDPADITDRGAWQPYNPADNTWGAAGQPATATITPPGQNWGELSFREVDGRPVLSGTNFHSGDGDTNMPTVEVHVGDNPAAVVNPGTPPTVVMSNSANSPNFVPAPYGGYILPGSTLDNLSLFGSQWFQPNNGPVHYDVQDIRVNVTPGHR